MKEKIQTLYNTLLLIETKGESTKIMADCLRYAEQLIPQTAAGEQNQNEKTKDRLTK